MVSSERPRIQLTRRWPAEVEQELAAHYELRSNDTDQLFSAGQLRDALGWADALCPTVTDDLSAEVFAGLNTADVRTRMLGNFGVGHDHIDLQAAQRLRLCVTNTPGVLTDATADLALTLLLMTARRAGAGERELRSGQWLGWRPTHHMGRSVTGKTLGIVGMGRIGQALAGKAHRGLDLHILYFSRTALPAALAGPLGAERCKTLTALIERSDFVSLHCPSTPATRHLIDAQALQAFHPHAILINTARGDILDEAALVDALAAGRLAGAGLDVYEREPIVHPGLLSRDDVVLLPHLGSATIETRTAMGRRVASNLAAFFAGQEPPDRVRV